MRLRTEGVLHETREIERAQQARAIGRQGLLAARIGAGDHLAIGKRIEAVDAVDEDDARLRHVIGGAHDPVPQIARLQCTDGFTGEDERPFRIVSHRLHEGIRHQHREIEVAQAARIALRLDEVLDVGMVAAERSHHGATPRPRRHDGAAHRVPHVHEGERPRGICPHTMDNRALGAEGGEIMADATALLQRLRRLLQPVEDAGNGITDPAHHEAVEQRHLAGTAGSRKDAAGGQEGEIVHQGEEAALPGVAHDPGLRRRHGLRHPGKAVGNAGLALMAVLQ